MAKSMLYYRENCNTDFCDKKYYQNLDFLDISENPMYFRKKEIPYEKTLNESHSIGYFKENHLIRFDCNGELLVFETHLVWEDNLVLESHTFLLGYRHNRRSTMKELLVPKPYSSFKYIYDDKSRLKEYYWKSYEDTNYGNRREKLLLQSYDYDEKGLKMIYQLLYLTNSTRGPYVIYDREKEQFMKQFTVSKMAQTNRSVRHNDGLIEFSNSHRFNTKSCPKCDYNLTYILTVNLKERKSINCTSAEELIPVLFCFECLSDQSYTLDNLNLITESQAFLVNAAYKFVGTTDEEKLDEAFLIVGGEPRWIQNNEHPNCTSCGKPMVFIMEIKSREHITNGKVHLMFGDCGSLYVFSCCENFSVKMQCT